jgi:hypothetical protein
VVYVANVPNPAVWALVGTVLWDPSACTTGERERGVTLDLRQVGDLYEVSLAGGRKGKELFVKIVSSAGVANQPWDLFNLFGQVGIHSTRLIGLVTNSGQ